MKWFSTTQRIIGLAITMSVLAVFITTSLAAPPGSSVAGSVAQLGGPLGCLNEPGSDGKGAVCRVGRQMAALRSLAMSPDGKNIYGVAMDGSALLVYNRDPVTGGVNQHFGVLGCFTSDGTDYHGTATVCTPANGIGKMRSVTVSPDGKNVYATSVDCPEPDGCLYSAAADPPPPGSPSGEEGTLLSFQRMPNGDLRQLTGIDGCRATADESPLPAHCGPAKGIIGPASVRVSPDGQNVYVTGKNVDDKADVAVFFRHGAEAQDGRLTQLTGNAGADGTALTGHEPTSVLVSPDNKNVYVVNSEGAQLDSAAPAKADRVEALGVLPGSHGHGSIDIFSRELTDATRLGALTNKGCVGQDATPSCDHKVYGLSDAIAGTFSPDGLNLYVASQGAGSPAHPGTVTHLRRNPDTGALAFQYCVSNDGTDGSTENADKCDKSRNTIAMPEPTDLVVSPDGKFLYVAAGDSPNGIVIFSIASDGTITQLPGSDGCVNEDGSHGCVQGRAVGSANAVVMSPDCFNVYTGSQDNPATLASYAAHNVCQPTSAATIPSCSPNGKISVSVSDATGGTALKRVHYRIDGGPELAAPTAAGNPASAVLNVPEGNHTLETWAEDELGRIEMTHHTANVIVDKTPPVVTIKSDQGKTAYAFGETATITTTATDENSGFGINPSAVNEPIPTNVAGKHTINKGATDNCGNTAIATFTYAVAQQLVLGTKFANMHVTVTPATAPVGKQTTFTFFVFTNSSSARAARVLAVKGATIRFDGRLLRADSRGKAHVRLALRKPAVYFATARKTGFSPASTSVRGLAAPRFTG